MYALYTIRKLNSIEYELVADHGSIYQQISTLVQGCHWRQDGQDQGLAWILLLKLNAAAAVTVRRGCGLTIAVLPAKNLPWRP